ncbi:FTR1 family protein [Pseudooceanicola sp. CBS1P-1]|uniref:Iron transporter n=1 Tax=Pseudooceanicola albus TaxID=2692189 RepID=A0A6L7GAN8_9RHOB|nr:MULTISPECIES: iron uptake transporter permease EfeU [Pseudooceanicola]MBT9387008.1 FTR1 family protein [Pseudooceanicola endophyticus]MXN21125.1 iron transporter [Pseudooceanicola albus]
MLAPFLIMLREGLEAALIVGIIAGYLRQTGRRAWLPAIWIGIFLAAALALFAGAALQLASIGFPQKTQELFEAVIGVLAVIVLMSMVFWMKKAARSLKASLQASIDAALERPGGGTATWALIGMVFFATAREGLESVFFLLAIFQQSRDALAPVGALAGIAVAALVGWGIYAGALKLNLARFFRWTGIFIIFVAAGLLAGSVKAFHEAGLWNGLQEVVWDASGWLPESSPLGTVLGGVLGYRDTPTLGELIVYLAFLAGALFVFLRPAAPAALREAR